MSAHPGRGTVQLTGMVVVTAALLAASCGTATQARPMTESADTSRPAPVTHASAGCEGFALSLASDHGGQPSPIAAAEWLSEREGVAGLPKSGWREDGQDESGSIVRSGNATVHVVRGSDGTWQVDSGSWC